MKILIKFSILKESGESFLFWSCVLDSLIETDVVDFKHLNKSNKYPISDCEFLYLKIEYFDYRIFSIDDIIKNCQKRPKYFIATDGTFQTGSPYKNASSLVETYYQDTFDFVKRLRNFCGFDSDYKLNIFHHNIIALIQELLGINIFKNESIPGALSIYNKLPVFSVEGQYNSGKGERYIIVSALDGSINNENVYIKLDILDKNKYLFFTFGKISLNSKYMLPDNLENFSQLRVSVFDKETDCNLGKLYEENFHLVRSFNFKMSVGGSHSKIVCNRYLNNQIEKISVYDHFNNISNKSNDFYDIEQSYKLLVFGKEKKYLECRYFIKNKIGREAFLDWVRKTVHDANLVKIIDPYFDNFGLNDFMSCCDVNFNLIVITINPHKRKKTKEYKADTKYFLRRIYDAFPNSNVYYTQKIHDRYLFIDYGSEQKLFSLSNSWNGTVNNFSMLIQEIPFKTALQIYDEINTYTNNDNLQIPPKTKVRKKRKKYNRRKFTEKYLKILTDKLLLINEKSNVNEIIELTSELFFANYFGKLEKSYICQIVKECFEKLTKQKHIDIINAVTEQLLISQKKSFDEENSYMDGLPFSEYNNPRECLNRLSNISMWPDLRSYHLNLNYGWTEVLNIFFKLYPLNVIETLLKYEGTICVKDKIPYHVSELIIQSFLTEYYPYKGEISDEEWKFIEEANSNVYVRMFFAISIIDVALFPDSVNILSSMSFADIIELLIKRLNLCKEEIALVLAKAINTISLNKKHGNNQVIEKEELIIEYIIKTGDMKSIAVFSFLAFIEPYDVKVTELINFLDSLENHNKKEEAETIKKIFLFYALKTNLKLQEKVRNLIGLEQEIISNYFAKTEHIEDEQSNVSIRKFITAIPYLSNIFAYYLKKNPDMSLFDKIVFSLPTDMSLIFNIKFPDKMTLFYYDLYFLLITVNCLDNKNIGSQNILDFISWYFPICIENYPNDFYGLGQKILCLYVNMINEEQKKLILRRLTYLPMKALTASSMIEQSEQSIEIYKNYIEQHDVEGYDKSILVENFLNIGILLCIRCADKCNEGVVSDIIDCISQINKKIRPSLVETAKPVLDYGMDYAKTASSESKKTFLDSIKNKIFFPYAVSLLEG